MAAKAKQIGTRLFVDGVERPVYRDPDGRQYVVADDKERVFGIWILDDEAENAAPMTLAIR